MLGEYARKRNRTREAFLQAAFEALPGTLGEGLLAAVGPAELARRAGLSRQTFYRHWSAGGQEFLDDLVAYLLAPERLFESTIIPDLNKVSEADPRTATELLRGAAIAEFETGMQAGPLLCQVVSWALLVDGLAVAAVGGPEPSDHVRAALRSYYNDYADDLVGAYEMLLEEWGLEMVPGVTVRQFAAVLTGMLEGMGMRWLVDPDLVSPSLYADAVLALVPAFTRRREGATRGSVASFLTDGRAVADSRSAEALSLGRARDEEGAPPVTAQTPHAQQQPPQSSQLRSGRRRARRSRSAIVAAARREFALRGYHATTVAGIASAAGVGETTVYEHFGSKAGVAAACFEEGHDAAVEMLAADDSGPMARLHNHLCRVYALLVADRASAKALFDAVVQTTEGGSPSGPLDPRALVPLPDAMVQVIEDAQSQGILSTRVTSWEIAGLLVGLLMLGVLMTPGDPETSCRRLESLAFDDLWAAGDRSGP